MTITYCGPSGGVKGGAFSDLQSAPAPNILEDSRISTVRIRSGLNIDSIQVTVQVRSTGQFIELPRRGGGGGGEHILDLRTDQQIVGIEGRFGDLVNSITFKVRTGTSVQDVGPFGRELGLFYGYRAPRFTDNAIIGFWGRHGVFLDSIGVFLLRPLPAFIELPDRPEAEESEESEEPSYSPLSFRA